MPCCIHYQFHLVLHETDNVYLSYWWQFAKNKSDLTFVILVSLKSDMSLKLNQGSDRLKKGSNWYPQRVLGIL